MKADAALPRRRPATASLDASAWVEAALSALAEGGIDAVRVEPLARRLGVTRGSFYWHFKDRDALHQAMLRAWRSRASYMIFDRLEHSAAPASERLARLLALPYSSPRSSQGAAIELAIRQWARRDRNAAKAVRHIDRARLEYFRKLLVESGVAPITARKRAFLFYAALLAEALIWVDDKDEARRSLEQLLLSGNE